jgi:disulfide bond formation protein DsbB
MAAVQFNGTTDWWLWRIAIACFAAVGGALVSQYTFDMQPCPWCVLQRLIYLLIGTLSLIGALVPWLTVRRIVAGGSVLLAILGVFSALWQHFVAAASDSCNLTLADRILSALGLYELLPWVFEPTASCADAAVNLLGVPYAIWSLVLFFIVGLGSIQVTKLPK